MDRIEKCFSLCFVGEQRVTWNVVYYNHINKEMFHLHFVLFKKSEFVMMSLIVLTLVVTGHRGPAGV